MEDFLKLKEVLLKNSWNHMQKYWRWCGRNRARHYLKKKKVLKDNDSLGIMERMLQIPKGLENTEKNPGILQK